MARADGEEYPDEIEERYVENSLKISSMVDGTIYREDRF